MRELVLVLRCDCDNSHLADTTVPWTWNGTQLETDLCLQHAAEMTEQMESWVAISRKAKRKKAAAKPSAPQTPSTKPTKTGSHKSAPGKELRDRVRAFAAERGLRQAGTGYLRSEVVDAWLLENPDDAAALGRA